MFRSYAFILLQRFCPVALLPLRLIRRMFTRSPQFGSAHYGTICLGTLVFALAQLSLDRVNAVKWDNIIANILYPYFFKTVFLSGCELLRQQPQHALNSDNLNCLCLESLGHTKYCRQSPEIISLGFEVCPQPKCLHCLPRQTRQCCG